MEEAEILTVGTGDLVPGWVARVDDVLLGVDVMRTGEKGKEAAVMQI